jgi:hypothetical protein
MSSKKSNRLLNKIPAAIFLFILLFFAFSFAAPTILRRYLELGIGSCKKIPVLCLLPQQKYFNIVQNARQDFIPFNFDRLKVSVPKGFSVIQELDKRYFYKKKKYLNKGSVIYTLRQDPGYFVSLFRDTKKYGINNNYDFIRRVAFASQKNIKGLNDAFFVVMKGIFIPDLGKQDNVEIGYFELKDKKGFIAFNMQGEHSYFNLDLVDINDNYYKIYIRDEGRKLDLEDVFGIALSLRSSSP